MPHVLIVSATSFEIQPLLEKYAIVATGDGMFDTRISENNHLSILITGAGMVNTAFAMGRYSNTLFDVIINAGICGAFNRDLKIGQVVHVCGDELIEMGAEDDDDFIKYEALNLGGTNSYQNNWLLSSKTIHALKKVRGATVNKVHGNDISIEKVKGLFGPDVESMEGAAFYASCQRLDNYTQLRAVSNYVEKRDKSKWHIPLAIENLNSVLQNALEDIYSAY